MKRYDIVIVGAGIAGASLAWQLAQGGGDAVIDRQDAPSFSWLPTGGICGRKGRFGKPGFTIILDYGKSVFLTVGKMGYQTAL